MPKKSPRYFPTYCMKTIAVAVTFIAAFSAASTLAVFLLKTTTLLPLFHIAPSASAQQQEDEGGSGEQQQEENDIDLAELSTTMTGEQTMTNETAAADQQIATTEISDLMSADFETTRENLADVRQGLLDNNTKAALDALNSADNSLFAVIISQKGSQGSGQTTTNEQLNSLQTQIDSARDVLRNGNYVKSLEALNTADSQLFNMTQSLEVQDMED
ncbi:MAG TPA: hypothetical protein VKA95_02005 [Nitrososphaeraceae archaeon]|nr:hypothetical protein [Nitrososphaeraceae archaeon]